MAPNSTFKSPTFLQLTVDILKLKTSTVSWEEFWGFIGVIGHNNKIREWIYTYLLTDNLSDPCGSEFFTKGRCVGNLLHWNYETNIKYVV